MSGVEIVGLILGILPLITQYKKSVGRIFGYGRRFDDLDVSLKLAMAGWKQTCDELLIGLSLPMDLLDEQSGWDDKDIQDILQEHLGQQFYDAFEGAANYIRAELIDLRDQLEPPEDWRSQRDAHGEKDVVLKSFFKEHLKRIKGGFKTNKYDEMLRNIEACIQKIGPIIPKAIQLGEQRQGHKRKRMETAAWIRSQEHSQRLHDSLETLWSAQQCSAHLHCAQMRLSILGHGDKALGSKESLSCSFILKDSQTASQLGCYHTHVIPISIGTSTHNDSTVPSISLPPEDDHQGRCSSHAAIADLCANLAQIHTDDLCRGVFHDQEWHYHVHDDPTPVNINPANTRSLREAILDTQLMLSTRERRTMCLLLASAVLQFHETSWLRGKWTLDDIVLSNAGRETHLAIAKDFEMSATAATQSNANDTGLSFRHDEMVYYLGVALLELIYRKPLSPYSDAPWYAIRVQEDELPNIASAVRSCIQHVPSDLESDGFLNWFHEAVLVPLQEDYDMLHQQTRRSVSSRRA
ncbi:uncharacterized protein J3D65DRAFT_642700 [Phyllosticta citribraziliensis]|uniref:DUF7580 domain-containing protein n=1 Tax=Phyllosticta citribraziliensis TaxID=989973 RepID=A0ABR1L7M0_9PEZI